MYYLLYISGFDCKNNNCITDYIANIALSYEIMGFKDRDIKAYIYIYKFTINMKYTNMKNGNQSFIWLNMMAINYFFIILISHKEKGKLRRQPMFLLPIDVQIY